MKIVITHWGMTEADVERIRAVVPDAEVVVTGDRDTALREIEDAEIAFGGGWLQEKIERGRRLRWVQIGSAGVDGLLTPEVRQSGVLLTNARGVFGDHMAEHAFALLLALARRIAPFVRAQQRGEWERCGHQDLIELSGRTMGLLGYGDIGRAIARRAAAFGMRCLAFRRTPANPQAPAERIETGRAGLHRILGECDVLALSLPLTQATRRLLGSTEFERCKKGALLVNVGRGAVCDEAALVQALQEGRLAGAGLDVFAEEPLPPASPLWGMPNVIITPHIAGLSERMHRKQTELFCANLRRYLAGEPLLNLVDLEHGY